LAGSKTDRYTDEILSDCTVMVVDDTEENIDILVETIGDDDEVCRRLKADLKIGDIPVIFITDPDGLI